MLDHSAADNDASHALEALCTQARSMFLMLLRASDIAAQEGKVLSTNTCMYASVLLSELLHKFGQCRATICGGDGERDGGYFDALGRGHGHYWVEAVLGDGRTYVCDITADQFGGPEVVVRPKAHVGGTYQPGDARRVGQHADRVLAEILATRELSAAG
jgi:hypothetical protein